MVAWVLGGSMESRVLHHTVRQGQYPAVLGDAKCRGDLLPNRTREREHSAGPENAYSARLKPPRIESFPIRRGTLLARCLLDSLLA